MSGAYWSSEDVNFLDIDLNLLIALDALLSERSVTRAAQRLARSQPALSASLKRLRRQFDDELLIRVGNQFELSPLAEQLQRQLTVVLSDIERVFARRARFDPERSQREFSVSTSDYALITLVPVIADLIAAEAPDVLLSGAPISDQAIEKPSEHLRVFDGMFLPIGYIGDMPRLTAYRDRWMILADAKNPIADGSLTLDDLTQLNWIMPFHRRGLGISPMRQLELQGIELRVTVAIDGFAGLPALVEGSYRVGFIQERLAMRLALGDRFALLECPFDVVALDEAMWWHPSLTADPGHIWFREIVRRAGAQLTS